MFCQTALSGHMNKTAQLELALPKGQEPNYAINFGSPISQVLVKPNLYTLDRSVV